MATRTQITCSRILILSIVFWPLTNLFSFKLLLQIFYNVIGKCTFEYTLFIFYENEFSKIITTIIMIKNLLISFLLTQFNNEFFNRFHNTP